MAEDISIIEAACQEVSRLVSIYHGVRDGFAFQESPATKEAALSLLCTLRSDDGTIVSRSLLCANMPWDHKKTFLGIGSRTSQ